MLVLALSALTLGLLSIDTCLVHLFLFLEQLFHLLEIRHELSILLLKELLLLLVGLIRVLELTI